MSNRHGAAACRLLPRYALASHAVRHARPKRGAIGPRGVKLSLLHGAQGISSNYFAYLIGRKQVTYEELRRQVGLVVQFMDQKRVEEELAPATLKQRQERLEQNAPGLTGLTTSTINGKTIVVGPEPAPAGRPIPAALIDGKAVGPPDHEVRLQPPESSPNAVTKHQRGARRVRPSRRLPSRRVNYQRRHRPHRTRASPANNSEVRGAPPQTVVETS